LGDRQLEGHNPRAHSGRQARRTQEERSTETRRRLVEAAIRVTQESGYANLTISKVAQEAGLTNGAMQHHFGSRDDLVLGMLDALYPALDLASEDIASKKLPIKERVCIVIDQLWQIYSRPEYLVIWDVAFGTRSDPQLSRKLQNYQRDIAARLLKQVMNQFADVGLTHEGAAQIFYFATSCLRGFAFQAVFAIDRRRSDVEQLKEIVCERIQAFASSGSRRK